MRPTDQGVTPEDIQSRTDLSTLMAAFEALGFPHVKGGDWSCPHPEHRGGDSVSIFRGSGGAAWNCHSGSHKPQGGGIIELVKLAYGLEDRSRFPEVIEIAARLVGLSTSAVAQPPTPAVSTPYKVARGESDGPHSLTAPTEGKELRLKLWEEEYRCPASRSDVCAHIARIRGWEMEALEHINVAGAERKARKRPGKPQGRPYPVMRWPSYDINTMLAGWTDRTMPNRQTGKSAKLSAPGKRFPVIGLPNEPFALDGRHVAVFEGEADFTSAVCGMIATGINEVLPVAATGAHQLSTVVQALVTKGATVTVVPDRDDAGRSAWKRIVQLEIDDVRCCYPPDQGGDYDDWAKGVGLAAAWDALLATSEESALTGGTPQPLALV